MAKIEEAPIDAFQDKIRSITTEIESHLRRIEKLTKKAYKVVEEFEVNHNELKKKTK